MDGRLRRTAGRTGIFRKWRGAGVGEGGFMWGVCGIKGDASLLFSMSIWIHVEWELQVLFGSGSCKCLRGTWILNAGCLVWNVMEVLVAVRQKLASWAFTPEYSGCGYPRYRSLAGIGLHRALGGDVFDLHL
jgi:hypothetical protein